MLLESARELKTLMMDELSAIVAAPSAVRTMAIRARESMPHADAMRSIAVGISQKGGQHRLAVRVQRRTLETHPIVERIREKTKGELDLRFIGQIQKRETPKTLQKKRRPLLVGCSIGHHKITAGTLGCFVVQRATGEILILSNNHVLANENSAALGDAILQPGKLDGSKLSEHTIGKLHAFIKLKRTGVNWVDCAVGTIKNGIAHHPSKLGSFGKLSGLGPELVAAGTTVHKVGRTTGETTGLVTAFELDNVVIEYDLGNLRFDNQIEIEGTGNASFSDGGDSGSLIFNDDRQAVALLFAGGDFGGSNGMGLTYANPLAKVLNSLKVDVAT